jgi:hypothetical protein
MSFSEGQSAADADADTFPLLHSARLRQNLPAGLMLEKVHFVSNPYCPTWDLSRNTRQRDTS